jgi:hypothetical protein
MINSPIRTLMVRSKIPTLLFIPNLQHLPGHRYRHCAVHCHVTDRADRRPWTSQLSDMVYFLTVIGISFAFASAFLGR